MAAEDLDKVNMHEAKTQLSRLVARIEGGEQIVITRAGKPAAMLVPVPRQERRRRTLGVWEHLNIQLPSDEEMAAVDKEIAEEFYGPEDEWPDDWKSPPE